jgi:hypothetical protein
MISGLLGIAEIEVVGGGQRPAPVAVRLRKAFGDGLLAALDRVGLT